MRAWWRGICDFAGPASAHVLIPIANPAHSVVDSARWLRRRLRRIRDRQALRCRRWGRVEIVGLIGADSAHLLVTGCDLVELQQVISVRGLPLLSMGGEAIPSADFDARDVVALALAARGVQPLRVLILGQADPVNRPVVIDPWGAPYPFVF